MPLAASHDHAVQRAGARTLHHEADHVAVLHAEGLGFVRSQVQVALRHDDPAGDGHAPVTVCQRTAGAALQIARHADRGLQAQLHRVGEGQLDLRFLAGRTYHTQGHFALFGLDGHALVAGELAGLGQVFLVGEGCAFAKQSFQIRLGHMDVMGGSFNHYFHG